MKFMVLGRFFIYQIFDLEATYALNFNQDIFPAYLEVFVQILRIMVNFGNKRLQ